MAEASQPKNPTGPPDSLIRALRALLRPLVGMLIAKGVTLPYVTEVLKAVYVDVAGDDPGDGSGPPTQSRISVITGVHRKDVRRLQSSGDAVVAPARATSLGSRLIGLWVGAEDFLDENGQPRPLYRSSASGTPSFEGLVRRISSDVRPRSILDEWHRLGLIEIDQEEFIRLNVRAFVPADDFDDTAYFYARNLRDHIAAASQNLLRAGPPFFERAVFYDGLSAESIAALELLCREKGEQAIVDINREALRLAEADDARGGAGGRMTFGAFFFSEDDKGRGSSNSATDDDDA